MIRFIIEWWKDRSASIALTEQYISVTGYPAMFTLKEGRAFRLSGLTAHEWILRN